MSWIIFCNLGSHAPISLYNNCAASMKSWLLLPIIASRILSFTSSILTLPSYTIFNEAFNINSNSSSDKSIPAKYSVKDLVNCSFTLSQVKLLKSILRLAFSVALTTLSNVSSVKFSNKLDISALISSISFPCFLPVANIELTKILLILSRWDLYFSAPLSVISATLSINPL